ncbi:alpha/beta-hydrolase [Xylariomycetidae sp. FL0641]|nr:alpha/beta-hydrolase [Xylariomycetidae sp. FL0641]
MARPAAAEISKLPAFPEAIWELQPHQSGLLPVARDRGGPLNISWEVHGEGPIQLVFIGGLGIAKYEWQHQTLHFGHRHASDYSVLVLDNRGVGQSSRPFMRYNTSEMALDVLEVASHLGWTGERSLHVVGSSMGGMIAQEVGYLAPQRIASLSLACTSAKEENTTSLSEYLGSRLALLLPRGLDAQLQYTITHALPAAWLDEADTADLPDASTPRCGVPENGYQRFPSNYARCAAVELQKRARGDFGLQGFAMQCLAAMAHCKSAAQLAQMGDGIGRERILVLHGTADQMMPLALGRRLMEGLRPGKALVVDGLSHAPMLERAQWFNDVVADHIASAR